MAFLPLALLSLAASTQAHPLLGLLKRQENQQLCGNPDITPSATYLVPGSQGDVTFIPSQVEDTALWTIPTPTTISETETIYPFGYVWAPLDPINQEVPPLPTVDVPYPLPEGASATLCNGVVAANTPAPEPTTTTTAPEESTTTVPPLVPTTNTEPVEEPNTPTSLTTEDASTTEGGSTTEVPPIVSTTFSDTTEIVNTPTTTEETTVPEETTTTETTAETTEETTTTTAEETTTVEETTTTTGSTTDETTAETTTEETTAETTTEETTTDKPTEDTTTTDVDTTTTEEPAEETTTDEATTADNSPTTTDSPDATIGFPVFDPPTTTVSGPEATDDAIDAGPIIFALWSNRDMIKDEEKKEEYIKKTEETRDDIVLLWTNFDVKPEIPEECGKTALRKRSLISGILDVLDDAAKLIGCATKVVENLVENVKLPDPPIEIIETLTDTLKEISEELEKEKEEEEEETDEVSTTDKPSSTTEEPTTTTTSCAETGVESCTQTVYLSTSFFKDGDVDTSTVETITTEDCVTITQCDAEPTTEVTTVTTATSTSASDIVCDVNCSQCNPQRRWEQPTLTPQERRDRRWLVKRMDNMDQEKYNTDEKKDSYVRRQTSEISDRLDWNTVSTNVVSIDGAWEDFPFGLHVEGLIGCTGVTIASDKGGWLAHFMEPGFFYDENKPEDDKVNNGRKDLWDEMMNQLRDQPAEGKSVSPKFKPPSRLANDDGILSSDSNVQIFVSVPRTRDSSFDSPTLLYQSRVDELVGYLTGNGAPFAGAEVIIKTYVKPPPEDEETDEERAAREKSARGIMFIEYDDMQEDWETGEMADPPDRMWRVWQERSYYERHMTSEEEEASPTCARHEDEANGMDPQTAKDLAKKFCEDSDVNFDEDAELQLGGGDLDPTQELAADIKFTFEKKDGECSKTCTEIYEEMVSTCQYNSHLYTGKAEYDLSCGKYAMDTIPVEKEEPEPEPEPVPDEVNNCADSTVYTKFSLGQAEEAISDFCGHNIELPKAAQPVYKTYKMDGVTLQLITQWSQQGQDGCNKAEDGGYHPELSQSDCEAKFNSAVNNCNTDTTSEKYGQKPYVWNSPNGCVDFYIYGDGEDWDCEGLGVVPVQCQTGNGPIKLD
ncbi:hypothetical protein NM208_g546 [Fusarium decemcellulare]|uniref:Uncharacterized protein n=1 Tax=Fusarium decemcellulare TaxID=57161 RepID=A0ACC1SZ90_9HYPO|nr:hypothetical protein NM208_g546 [Fusarium decemcellulare]